jgi:hypothetical protein
VNNALLYYADHPVDFVEDIIGARPDKVQADILRSVASCRLTSVRSGHGVGKSAVQAWAMLWFMATRPFPKVPCTAPTRHQLYDILWAEVSKWIRQSPLLAKEFVWTKEKLYLKGQAEEWFAVPRTATTPDALQGFHAQHVLYIIDEASGVEDSIFEPVLGALSTPGARLLMCGNPTRTSGFFYDSHHKNRALYSVFHVDSRDSQRVSREYVDTLRKMYGEDSDLFRVRVAGEFPRQEDDVFIPLHLIERSSAGGGGDGEAAQPPAQIHIGCDVARFGGDRTVIGYKIDNRICFYKKQQGQDTMRTADNVVLLGEELIARHGYEGKIAVKVDDGGVGGGVVDRLRQMKRGDPGRFWWLEVFPVHFGTSIKHAHYADSTSYMMGVLKRLLESENIQERLFLPDDGALIAQLAARKYGITDSSKIKVESKNEMKKRGLPSPDEADCVLLCVLPVKIKQEQKSIRNRDLRLRKDEYEDDGE